MNSEDLELLVRGLLALPKETEWVEFKHNNCDPQKIGRNTAALSNSAALSGQSAGYILWGVENETHQILGTSFTPSTKRVQNQELENWLLTRLDPRIDVSIHEGCVDGSHVVLFEIQPAHQAPVCFDGDGYIRIGSYTKPLKDHPEKARQLWALATAVQFEEGVALDGVTADDVLEVIDYPRFFKLHQLPLPDNRTAILERLRSEKVIRAKPGETYDVTNYGGILFAASLRSFDLLKRKAIRVVVYGGDGRVNTLREQEGDRGYAVGFEGAIRYINDQLPRNEAIGEALRRDVPMFPEIAIRELVANAIIHQDFSRRGSGPMVEIFASRLEITNPGTPLVDPQRFLDSPPQSRNEVLASGMRRVGVCEERGSGIDKVVTSIELYQLPPPVFSTESGHTHVILHAYRPLSQMGKSERSLACYQHASLRYVTGQLMSNESLRGRFGIEDHNYSTASRIIRDCLAEHLIKPHDPTSRSKKHAKYVPFWA